MNIALSADLLVSDSLNELLNEGKRALDRGDVETANWAVEQVLSSLGTLDDRVVRSKAKVLGAQAAIASQAFERATACALEAVSLAQEVGQQSVIADGVLVLARVSYEIGDFEQALVELEQVRPLVADGASEATMFSFNVFVGNVHLALGQFEEAIEVGIVAERIARSLDNVRSMAVAAGNLASYWFSEYARRKKILGESVGNEALHHAFTLNEEAIRLASECGADRLNLSHYSNQGAILAALGKDQQALEMFARHREMARSLGQAATLPAALFAEASLERRLGRSSVAAALLREGIEIGELGSNPDLTDLYELASEIAEAERDFEAALHFYKGMYRTRTRCVTQAAEQRSLVMAVRLSTDRALRAAASERANADQLRQANQLLEQHAEKLGRQALEDALTGLPNRRRLDIHLAKCFSDPAAKISNTCVAILDVDLFKQVNDRFSHAIGDQVLRQVGVLIQASCRGADLAARSGGEEFVLCLHDVGLERAASACERVRAAIERHEWSSIAEGLGVTVSIGLTEIASHNDADAALAAADALLYKAKREGRNRVCASTVVASRTDGQGS